MRERIAAGTHLNTSLRVWLADRRPSWLDPEGAEAALLLWTKWFTKISTQHHMGPATTCPMLILNGTLSTHQQGKPFTPQLIELHTLIPIQRACLKRGWAQALVDVWRAGVNMTDGITRKASQQFRRAWNRAGFSCIPVYLPTCSVLLLRPLRCTVSTLCLVCDGSWRHHGAGRFKGGQREEALL